MTAARVVPATEMESGQRQHQWVGAALVDMGRGGRNARAEHAARTGRHVIPTRTRIDVLEVYCARCRTSYDSPGADMPCTTVIRRAV